MIYNLTRTASVVAALLPLILSIVRDWRRYIFFGSPRLLTEEEHRTRAALIRQKMGRLGPTFIKGAQVLAMREDIIPPVYARELRKLQDQVPPFAVSQVSRILRQDLGAPLNQLFDKFDREPLAAASLGQVHRAVYQGRQVAVKVLRPGVYRLVETDLRAVFILLQIMKLAVDPNLMRSFSSIVQEYRRMIELEMDFRNEKEFAERLRRNFKNDPRVYIPSFYPELTTRRVAVLEFVEGVRVDDAEGIHRLGVSSKELVDLLIETYTRMVVVHGFIHADPHPGNLLVDRWKRLVILDYGMALEFSESTRLELLNLVYAVVKRDADSIVECYYNLGMVDAEINRGQLRDAARMLLDIQLDSDITVKQIQEIAQQTLETFYKFPLRLPQNLVYLMRAATLVEGIALNYDPRFNSIKAATPIVKRMLAEIAFQGDKPLKDRILEGGKEIALTFRELLQIIHRMEREQFKVRIHEADLIEVERVMTSLLRRFLVGLALCTLAIVHALRGPGHPIVVAGGMAILIIGIFLLVIMPAPRGNRSGPYFR